MPQGRKGTNSAAARQRRLAGSPARVALTVATLLAGGVALSTCGEPGTEGGEPPAAGAEPSAASIRVAYQHLMDVGYFPNPALAARRPEWRPIVPALPADPGVVDATFALALRKYQQNAGLPPSGAVDDATLAVMAARRCRVPDRDPALPRRNPKFASDGFSWAHTNITYRFTTAGGLPGLSTTATRAAVRAGMNKWGAVTNLTFREVTSGAADVLIQWAFALGAGGITSWDGVASMVMTIDNTPNLPWTSLALQQLATHEWGHAIDLEHTPITTAVMYPSANHTDLIDDDMLSANVLYNTWDILPGSAFDIGIGPRTGGGDDVWMIDRNGKQVYEWNESTRVWNARGAPFTQFAQSIAVDRNGRAWVATSLNDMFAWNGSSWVKKPGSGYDMAAGPSGKIYSANALGFVQVLNSAGTAWTSIGHPPTPLGAIGSDRAGDPFALASDTGAIYHYVGGVWTLISSGLLFEIASGGGTTALSYTWGVGLDRQPYIWSRQNGDPNIGSGIPDSDYWGTVPYPSGVFHIAVGARGRPWLVDFDGQIARRHGLP